MIAQGRGEAFDYLVGEKTPPFARRAAKAAACALLLARNPVISVNGNVAALCPREAVALAAAVGARLEINLFYRTEKRVEAIRKALKKAGAKEVLVGSGKDEAAIPELSSERRRVSRRGIYSADVVLVPLEDGDRTTALVRMGKTVIAVDLNPISVTARAAGITVVDNVVRALPEMAKAARRLRGRKKGELRAILRGFDNRKARAEALRWISRRLERLARGGKRG